MNQLTDMQVLVTGGAGFIGSHIAESLVADKDVVVLDDFSTGCCENVPKNAKLLKRDVREASDLEQVGDVDLVSVPHKASPVNLT